ncbi:hypothetical protein ACLOJK_034047 [Asimina triloba]
MLETAATDSTRQMGKGLSSASAVEEITARLSSLEGLYFPRAVGDDAFQPSKRKDILGSLLSRDAAVFLERYGTKLTDAELQEFESLKDDYEINWHLNHIRSTLSPTTEEIHTRSVAVKNRRRAYLNKLIRDGQYFSEDAMREREPYLHHEYVGRFQDRTGRCLSRPGERWSETLMRRSEEAILLSKIRGEQQRRGVLEKDWVGNEVQEQQEEEEEEEDEDEDEDAEPGDGKGENGSLKVHGAHGESHDDTECANAEHSKGIISAAEMQDQMELFTNIMQQKFLAGEDSEHMDYSKIDDDVTLDDDWLKEVNQDAEEKYFAED